MQDDYEWDTRLRDELILDAYSRWLEKHGYLDSDWYTEGNAPKEFLAEYYPKVKKWTK